MRFSVILFANLLSFQDDIFPGDFSHLANEFSKALTGDFVWLNGGNNFT